LLDFNQLKKEVKMKENTTTRNALKSAAPRLLAQNNVVATGVGYKVTGGEKTSTLCIVCSVTEKIPKKKLSQADLVPQTVDGVPTDVIATGRIRAFQSPTERLRPAPGGSSIGHREITAGTLGCLVKRGSEVFILSNNHVLANSNDAQPGDAILQPGPYDGGTLPADHIANLEDFVPIGFVTPENPSDCKFASSIISILNAGCAAIGSRTRYRIVRPQAAANLVDAAIARPLNPEDVSEEIIGIGTLKGSAEAELGMAIQKSGRTTGHTTGVVEQIDVTVNVQYGAGRIAQFSDQLLAGPMSQGGDSGSAVLDMDRRLVGLLFAGSDTTTIFNRIQNVFSALNLSL
jgi:hypothetical protein